MKITEACPTCLPPSSVVVLADNKPAEPGVRQSNDVFVRGQGKQPGRQGRWSRTTGETDSLAGVNGQQPIWR